MSTRSNYFASAYFPSAAFPDAFYGAGTGVVSPSYSVGVSYFPTLYFGTHTYLGEPYFGVSTVVSSQPPPPPPPAVSPGDNYVPHGGGTGGKKRRAMSPAEQRAFLARRPRELSVLPTKTPFVITKPAEPAATPRLALTWPTTQQTQADFIAKVVAAAENTLDAKVQAAVAARVADLQATAPEQAAAPAPDEDVNAHNQRVVQALLDALKTDTSH